MIRNVTQLEFEKDGKNYYLTCEMDSSLADVTEALVYFLKCVNEVQEKFNASQAQQAKLEEIEIEKVE